MSYGGGGGHVIFSFHLGVGHSVLLQLEGVGHVFSNHHISKCPGPPTHVLFDQSLKCGIQNHHTCPLAVVLYSSTNDEIQLNLTATTGKTYTAKTALSFSLVQYLSSQTR